MAHRGTDCRQPGGRAVARCSCAADGEPNGGGVPAARYSHPRAGYRSAQDLLFIPSFTQAPCAFRGADGGTSVEVPTIVSFSSLHGLVEQNVDIPVPHGRGRVGGGGLFGLHPGQSSTAFGEAEHRFPAATAEQIVDIPDPRGGRQDPDLLSAASSSGLPGMANQGVFRTFPRLRSELGADFTSSTPAAQLEGFLHGCSWRCVDAVP